MFLMPVFNLAGPETIIETLNLVQLSEEEYESRVNRCRGPDRAEVPRSEINGVWKATVSRWLRVRVDDWLGTGLNPDGSESPCKRDLDQTQDAGRSLRAFWKKNPLAASVIWTVGSPEPTVTIGDVPSGSGNRTEYLIQAAAEADRLFTVLVLSDWKQLVCKCRYCGRYFLLKSQPRQSYRYGTFCCRSHQTRASATTCTANHRTRLKYKLVESAAKQLMKWRIDNPGWLRDSRQKLHLAAALSVSIRGDPNLSGYRKEVGVNWVTRHGPEIEEMRQFACRPHRFRLLPNTSAMIYESLRPDQDLRFVTKPDDGTRDTTGDTTIIRNYPKGSQRISFSEAFRANFAKQNMVIDVAWNKRTLRLELRKCKSWEAPGTVLAPKDELLQRLERMTGLLSSQGATGRADYKKMRRRNGRKVPPPGGVTSQTRPRQKAGAVRHEGTRPRT